MGTYIWMYIEQLFPSKLSAGVCSQAQEQILITSDEIPKRKYRWLALVQE